VQRKRFSSGKAKEKVRRAGDRKSGDLGKESQETFLYKHPQVTLRLTLAGTGKESQETFLYKKPTSDAALNTCGNRGFIVEWRFMLEESALITNNAKGIKLND